jgi:hypothetical protein
VYIMAYAVYTVQYLQSVFTPLYFFHILLCYSLD